MELELDATSPSSAHALLYRKIIHLHFWRIMSSSLQVTFSAPHFAIYVEVGAAVLVAHRHDVSMPTIMKATGVYSKIAKF